jgi:hypothetical protein
MYRWYGGGRAALDGEVRRGIAESDAVVFGGGQILQGTNFGFAPRMNLVFDVAEELRKPIGIHACGASTDWDGLTLRYLRNALARAGQQIKSLSAVRCGTRDPG